MDLQERYRLAPGRPVELDAIDPADRGGYGKAEAEEELQSCIARLRELQYLLYAENRRSLLICLQAMDTGGKDGTIRHVLGHMNPQGCRVKSFKVPSAEEAAHDFLWRVHKETPARGEVVIFNRSHYEDVLVARVHGLVSKAQCKARYAAINAFEKNLAQGGTHILKFFLHISRDEQLERLNARLQDPTRHWKVSEADYAERARWDDYMRAYEDALAHCNTAWAPWYVVPADRKWLRNLAVARIVVGYLEGLGMQCPGPAADIAALRRAYHEPADGSRG